MMYKDQKGSELSIQFNEDQVELVVSINRESFTLQKESIEVFIHEIEKISDLLENSNINGTLEMLYGGEGKLDALIIRNMLKGHTSSFNNERMSEEAEVFIGLPQENIDLFTIEQIQNACGEFMEAMDFELKTQDQPIYGSFFQKLQFWKKEGVQSEVSNLYGKGKQALEEQYIGLPSAERTEKLSNAAASVITALGGVEKGVLRLGGILVVKSTHDGVPTLMVETLSPELANLLDKNPIMLKNPDLIFDMIASMQQQSVQIEEADSAELAE